MKLETLTLQNFRCYQERHFVFHPNVNLVVGRNAAGKTALLDAISVAMASWLIGFKKKKLDGKAILPTDATLTYNQQGEESMFPQSWPVEVSATGVVGDNNIEWERTKHSETGNTRYGNATELINLAKLADEQQDSDIILPMIGYYGTMRLWQDPRATKAKPDLEKSTKPSRLDGYKHSVDPRIAVKELVKWFAKQAWRTFQQGKEPTMLRIVRRAVLDCIEGATELRYDADREELLLTIGDNDPQPFSILSDGQRCVLAVVADMAQKAAILNSHLGEDLLKKTPGIILIDELDLHLHPLWQRRIIEDLRTTFPEIQFIFTTHSPFLIQSLRDGEELLMLEGMATAELANKTLEDIAFGIMSAGSSQVSNRYDNMKGVAIEYMQSLNEAKKAPEEKLAEYKERLAESIAPYADNPAYQAFLEMQRIAKLGS
ncbi:AAA family ATPase [Vibrio splendidus]|uniref:AAA family ATPase n=1 Tax=Vibrio TaxID=662 RepID=UPI002469582E|nr:AAA family ATPase [Vibrio splendidus]MDH5938673.1 AAA family ATPase [Vibrio splendidus]